MGVLALAVLIPNRGITEEALADAERLAEDDPVPSS
jgi:hypothetical protein